MPFSVNIIRLLEKVDSPLKDVLIEILAEIEKQRKQQEETVTKTEFNDLKSIVAELVEAQKRTEQKVAELADAQKNTEQRVTKLEETAQKLIEAQKDAERRLTRLENTVQGLIEAQKRTEEELRKLVASIERQENSLVDSPIQLDMYLRTEHLKHFHIYCNRNLEQR